MNTVADFADAAGRRQRETEITGILDRMECGAQSMLDELRLMQDTLEQQKRDIERLRRGLK